VRSQYPWDVDVIFLHKARLVVLSQPKTGTTALGTALARQASLMVSRPPELKHMSYRGFMHFMAPLIEAQTGLRRSDYEVAAVMREPLDWLGSWYRYRTRNRLKKPDNARSANFTGNISFDDFALDVCRPDEERPQYARIKTPSWVALGSKEAIGVDRLFPYEAFGSFLHYVAERTGKALTPDMANVSPEMELSPALETRERISQHFAFDVALHTALSSDGTVPPEFRAGGHYSWTDDDLSPGV